MPPPGGLMGLLGTMGKDDCDECGKSLGPHGTFIISDENGAQIFCERYFCRFKRWLRRKWKGGGQ